MPEANYDRYLDKIFQDAHDYSDEDDDCEDECDNDSEDPRSQDWDEPIER